MQVKNIRETVRNMKRANEDGWHCFVKMNAITKRLAVDVVYSFELPDMVKEDDEIEVGSDLRYWLQDNQLEITEKNVKEYFARLQNIYAVKVDGEIKEYYLYKCDADDAKKYCYEYEDENSVTIEKIPVE